MDIFVEVLSFILEQYFGWDEYEIAALWRSNPGRRRSIIRQIGSGLPKIFTRLYSKRSIIREIGSRLPLRPVTRPRFQTGSNDLRNELDYVDGSTEWIMGPEYYNDTFSCSIGISDRENSKGLLSLMDGEGLLTICDEDIPKETTDSVQISNIVQDPDTVINNNEAMKKISALEEELNKLRAQIACLVAAPPSTPSVLQILPLTSTPCTPGAPPPLPPPPPPPPPAVSTPVKSVIDVIKENRSRRKTISGVPTDKPSNIPNMADVLKGLGSVKLKSIQRSPGGTPVRSKPLESEGSDPSSIIARALKKKFAHRRKLKDADSPSLDKENMSSFSPSPNKSPKVPQFGPHLLKPAKGRRLSGTDHNTGTLTYSSPLAEINV